MSDSLDILIVNWNSGAQLRQCLDTVRRAYHRCFVLNRVVVVDNASADGSSEALPAGGLPLEVIHNTSNLGFAAAVNQAAKASKADLLLLLNPDTLLDEHSLDISVAFLRDRMNARVAIVGIQLLGSDGLPQRSCAQFPTPLTMIGRALGLHRLSSHFDYAMSGWDHASSRQVSHVIGAFYMVRRSVFESLGGFDERFFVYLEDLDFSARAAGAGFTTWYLTNASVFHKGGGSSEDVKPQRLAYSLHSRLLYAQKHFGLAAFAAVAITTMLVEPLVRACAGLLHFSMAEVREIARGYAILWHRVAAPHLARRDQDLAPQ